MTASIESVRSYWESRPCNIRHSPERVGTRAYFDDVEKRKYFVEPHIPEFAQFEKWRGRYVVEIGCGLGTDTISFARAGAQVTAVDLTESAVELVKLRAYLFGLDNISVCRADAEALPWAAAQCCDLVYSFGVLHHTPHPEKVLSKAYELLKPGGTLKVMLYHKYSWKFLTHQQPEAQPDCPVVYTYSRKEARRLIEAAGFKVKELYVRHIFPYRVADYLEYRYVKAWPFNVMPAWLFHGLERILGAHILITGVKE